MIKIKFYGIGGQGVVTAANILSAAVCKFENKFAKTFPAYGHERRGAPVYCDLIISDEKILLNTFVYQPDILVIFDPSLLKLGIDLKNGLSGESVLVLNSDDEKVIDEYVCALEVQKVWYSNATSNALKHINRDIPNTGMLGLIAKTGVVEFESVISAFNTVLSENDILKNQQIALKTYEEAKSKILTGPGSNGLQ